MYLIFFWPQKNGPAVVKKDLKYPSKCHKGVLFELVHKHTCSPQNLMATKIKKGGIKIIKQQFLNLDFSCIGIKVLAPKKIKFYKLI